MQNNAGAEPKAFVFASDPDERRDLQIFLRRSCGFIVDGGEIRPAAALLREPLFDPQPRLMVISGQSCPDTALGLLHDLRAAGLRSFILYLASSGTLDEAGDAFAAGADDVQRAPLTLRELGLRLRARLGVKFSQTGGRGSETVPQVLIDRDNRLHAAGLSQSVRLTRAEAELMAVLIRSGGEIVSRDELARQIGQAEWEYGDRRYDVHVANIRKKLHKAFGGRYALRSIRFKGYVFCEEVQAESV
ncbi:transcriptional regulator [Defluviimonas sp. 20V17]|uniref:DNA-binding response regulator, OmpR family, contains REC and winged-helix (WHTH) domain n=1 Tax=Allgaiera indica TaxID=765699 RepID=A0AAN4UNY1_9RHOB|nr:winged helix-turn-helix domain-containing protein [Allgaiera indica]KDB03906.1 transcriptional regulator [Defluviimonas sp. 20V17]GHD99222.1 hypothetical protein GCM10008024_05740 [Allgaiera indica]SDW31089.1 DNA-binding response regulator, OmpR family, contains REC and winged-helix (wHTH) domain [Allgaiera indica]